MRRTITAIVERPWALGLLGVATLGVFGVGGYYAYRTYDYIEHDNDFCMSCHLMAEPYELFGESAHRGLGCKACHQPNMVERSSMAIAQIVENPDSLRAHAHVPDERCVTCHVEGNPEEWRQIANTAGHRVHLESVDSTLADVQCVGCHQSSLHQFTAVDETCAQSGCHTESSINLGEMSNLSIHCAACHTFTAPIAGRQDTDAALAALQPTGGECLTCHAMRERVSMPEDDPHEGLCASCHNPHIQETPAEAVESCATGGCHDDAPDLTDFHVGLHQETLDDCSNCHTAHDFSVQGEDCTTCHQDIFDDEGSVVSEGERIGAALPAGVEPALFGAAHPGMSAGSAAGALVGSHASVRPRVAPSRTSVWPAAGAIGVMQYGSPGVFHPGAPLPFDHPPVPDAGATTLAPQVDSVVFRHAEHREVDCLSCHTTEGSHGRLTVTTLTDCRSCHHTEPDRTDCAACHEDGAHRPESGMRVHTMDFKARNPVERELPFDHVEHAEEECATCHTEQGGLSLSAETTSCSSCHEEHHGPQTTCRSCHQEAPDAEHPVEDVHVGCSGASCHTEPGFENVPRFRELCLTCHQDLVDHKVEEDRDCAVCHTLPEPGEGE